MLSVCHAEYHQDGTVLICAKGRGSCGILSPNVSTVKKSNKYVGVQMKVVLTLQTSWKGLGDP